MQGVCCAGWGSRSSTIIIYFDEAQSGSVRSRPGLEALKKAAEDKQFDALLVDDSSRLSRDNQHFNTLLCLFQYWGISLISVSDGLDMREEHAKVAYQFGGIINELYLTDLKKDAPRTNGAGATRVFCGQPRLSYTTVPEGESNDRRAALRADGFKLVIIPEEARIIQRIFQEFIEGKAVTKIPKRLNQDRVPTQGAAQGRMELSTVSRILKRRKVHPGVSSGIGPRRSGPAFTGKMRQVDRPKEEWVIQERKDIRIIPDEQWDAAQARWREIDGVFPRKRGKKGSRASARATSSRIRRICCPAR
ncbi:MAG: recombinase family protein [Polyangiaceae bacterium]